MSIPKKTRDTAMKIILDFHQSGDIGHSIGPMYLSHHGLPNDADAVQVVELLRSMGYICYTKERDGKIYDITPTDSGLSYFEKEDDDAAKTKKIFTHEWKIAIFSAITGALLSKPLWAFFEWLQSLFH